MADLSSYSRTHRHILDDELPPLLARRVKPGVIVDLGCGDGAVLWALMRRGFLRELTYAVDLSPERVKAAASVAPGIVGIVSDATCVREIGDASVDGVVCSQVIEHLPEDHALAFEVVRVLKPGGWWYVGTVLRGRHAWWIYRVDGQWRLDPTHVREYAGVEELLRVLDHRQLRPDEIVIEPLHFPLTDLALRAAALARLIPFERVATFYRDRPVFARTRRLRVRVPGYSRLEVFGHRI